MSSSDARRPPRGERSVRRDPYQRAWDQRRRQRRVGTIAGRAKAVVTVVALLPPLAFALMLALGLKANVMITGSMEPKLPVHSLLLYETVAPEALEVGDVISFQKPRGDRAIATHRIIAIEERGGGRVFQTKGDNNAVPDPWLIRYDPGQEPNRLVASVPYLGNVLLLSRVPLARIALIVVVLGFLFLAFLRALAGSRNGKEGRARAADEGKGRVPVARSRG